MAFCRDTRAVTDRRLHLLLPWLGPVSEAVEKAERPKGGHNSRVLGSRLRLGLGLGFGLELRFAWSRLFGRSAFSTFVLLTVGFGD